MVTIEEASCNAPDWVAVLYIVLIGISTILLIYMSVSFKMALDKESELRKQKKRPKMSWTLLAMTFALAASGIVCNITIIVNELNCLLDFFATDKKSPAALALVNVLIGCYAIQIIILIAMYFQRLTVTLGDSSYDYSGKVYKLFRIGLIVASGVAFVAVLMVSFSAEVSIIFNIILIVLYAFLSGILWNMFTQALLNIQLTMFRMDDLRMNSITKQIEAGSDAKHIEMSISKEEFEASGPLMNVMTKNTVLVTVSIITTFSTMIISILRSFSSYFDETSQTFFVMFALFSFALDSFVNIFCAFLQFTFWDQNKYQTLCGKIDKCSNDCFRNKAISKLKTSMVQMVSREQSLGIVTPVPDTPASPAKPVAAGSRPITPVSPVTPVSAQEASP